IFDKFGFEVGSYLDPGPHFVKNTQEFAESCGTLRFNLPIAAKRAVGIIEKVVDVLQRALKKIMRRCLDLVVQKSSEEEVSRNIGTNPKKNEIYYIFILTEKTHLYFIKYN
ncbi:hypothetical protein OnM2_069028, partial [Erysiphe neolycopersici]